MIEKKSRSEKMVEERKQMGTCYLFLIREGVLRWSSPSQDT